MMYFYNTMAASPLAGAEKCYTIEEVAAHLNISVSNMRRLVVNGIVPSIKLGRQYRIFESDLIMFLKQNRGKSVSIPSGY